MGDQRIILEPEWNEMCREAEAARNQGPICCCENGGEPFEMGGVTVVARNAGCRVHRPEPKLYAPIDAAEPIRSGHHRKYGVR